MHTPMQMNERLFGMYPSYVEAKATGTDTPVLDALSVEKPDLEMLEKALQASYTSLIESFTV
jgi:hypothetical protein